MNADAAVVRSARQPRQNPPAQVACATLPPLTARRNRRRGGRCADALLQHELGAEWGSGVNT